MFHFQGDVKIECLKWINMHLTALIKIVNHTIDSNRHRAIDPKSPSQTYDY